MSQPHELVRDIEAGIASGIDVHALQLELMAWAPVKSPADLVKEIELLRTAPKMKVQPPKLERARLLQMTPQPKRARHLPR